MNKFDKAIARYQKSFVEKLNRNDIDENLLRAITTYLGPSIYSPDASKVACAKTTERNSVKTDFLIKKLKLKDSPALDAAIKEVCQTMGSSNRTKYRAIFYYLLVEKYGKQDLFVKEAAPNNKARTTTSGTKEKVKTTTSGTKESDTKTQSSRNTKTNNKKKKKDNTGRNMDPEMIIERHSIYAAGAGFVPIPIIDLVSISAVQYKMIKKLAAQYDHVSFDSSHAQTLIAAFMGGVGSFEVGIFSRIFFKGIPVFGPIIGGAATASFAYYTTKEIGKLFDEHFRSGGDMSIEERTFEKMKEYFNFEMKSKKKKTA